MYKHITPTILIIFLAFYGCRKPEESNAPVNLLQVFNANGTETRTKDGGFIFTSGTQWNIKLERFDKEGNKLWVTNLGNYLIHYPNYKLEGICETNENGIAGLSLYQDTIYGFTFLRMFKVDNTGRFLWERNVKILYTRPTPDYFGFINDGNNHFISSYFQWSAGLSSGIIRIDSSGNILSDHDNGLITVSVMGLAGNYLFVVAADFFAGGTFLYKLDSSANKIFQTPVLTNNNAQSQFYQINIFPAADGGCVVSGYTNAESNTYNFYVQKFSSTGDLEWIKKYGTMNNDYLSTSLQTSDGGLLLIGTSSINALIENNHPDLTLDFNCKIFVAKLDANYNLEWDKMIGGNFGSVGMDATEDESGQLYILGKQVSHGNDAINQMFILRLTPDGNY